MFGKTGATRMTAHFDLEAEIRDLAARKNISGPLECEIGED